MSDNMPQPPLPLHGGDLAFATRIYGMPRDGWLDVSTGINPYAYPAPPIPPAALHRLPDNEALLALMEAARAAYRVPPGVGLAAVPGSEAAIRLLPHVVPDGKVAIVQPTYGTYSKVWRDADAVSDASAATDVAVVVVGSPNNPDGRILRAEELPPNAFAVIDEAFADLPPDSSIIPTLRGKNAIVLRSLGKFYGLAGVRLGFVIGPQLLCDRLGAHFGAWPVSGPAIVIGTAALSDTQWRNTMRARLASDAAALRSLLVARSFNVVGGTDLFVLAEIPDAHALHRRLAQNGVWTRAFEDYPRWLRFGMPGADNMDRLDAALSAAR
jgi:cobalamin biosynthetic protein CobC